jgi:myo-inositol 2-dehydrogenase/D-chiro-inositol 1-dehydrogenase
MTDVAGGKTIDVAVFGAGRIGRIHAANLARQPGVRLKYVVDVNKDAAASLAALHGAQVADIDGAMGDASIGATVICSSTDTHADLIQYSAAQKKHVFCEKPVDLTLERARTCAQAVERAGVVCMIGFQRRFDPTFAALKARIDAGEIGTPEMLIVTSRDPGAPPVEYIKHSGGIFKDMLIHDFDIFRWILDDEAETLHATGSCLSDPAIAEAGDIDATAVTIRTKSGRLPTATISASKYSAALACCRPAMCVPLRWWRIRRRKSRATCPKRSFSNAIVLRTPRKSPTSSKRSRRANRFARL